MRKIFFLFVFAILKSFFALSQESELFIPFNIKQAYHQKTRSFSGAAGERYWQNKTSYQIEAEFFPKTQKIKGKEIIVYVNNSPQSISEINFKIYQNLYQKGVKRDREITPSDLHDGVKIDEISVNGEKLDYFRQPFGTNYSIHTEIESRDSIKIELKWELTIPKKTHIRMGSYDSTSFFIAYWYPRIAVYDDIDGWDNLEYNGLNEFYDDFSNYDVKITVPNDFMIWATGFWQNPTDILSQEIFSRYENAKKSDKVFNIISIDDYKKNNIFKKNEKNVFHYVANDVSDFCFGTSSHYLWDGVNYFQESTRENIFISAVYNRRSSDFHKVCEIAKLSIDYLSTKMPAYPFPYPFMTVFNGEDGMEFPMMVNDGSCYAESRTVHLTSHEISHSYFPFLMGIHQVKYSWMDEGWAMFLPEKFQNSYSSEDYQESECASVYEMYAGTEFDAPLMQPSTQIRGYEYYVTSYYKAEIAYRFLYEMLGEAKFKECLTAYFNRWKGKHPTPYDFFFTFNDVAKENLNWFWKIWFFERGYPDLSIEEVKINGESFSVTIERKGNLPVPIYLTFFTDNGEEIYTESVRAWEKGNKKVVIEKKIKGRVKSIKLGNDKIPDVFRENNVFENQK